MPFLLLNNLKLEQLITRKKSQKKQTKDLVAISEWQKLFRKVSLLLIIIKRKKDKRIKYPKIIIYKKIEKKLKDEGTEIPAVPNKIRKKNIANDEYKLRSQKNSKIKNY